MTLDMNSEYPEQQVRKEGIKLGIYLGILSLIIAIVSIFVLVNASNFKVTSMVSAGVNFVLGVGVAAYFSVLLRKSGGGFWTFSQALKGIFVMFAISVIISSIGSAVFNLVSPEQQQIVFDKTINLTIETLENAGLEDDVIDKQVAELEKGREEVSKFSFGRSVKALAITLIIYFVFALILAAILKREKPMFLKVDNAGDSAHPWQENN